MIATVAVGSFPAGVAVNPGGTRVYVANAGANTLSVIDATTNTALPSVTVGSGAQDVAVNAAGTRVYVTNAVSNTVSVVNAITTAVVATVPGFSAPKGVVVHWRGTRLSSRVHASRERHGGRREWHGGGDGLAFRRRIALIYASGSRTHRGPGQVLE